MEYPEIQLMTFNVSHKASQIGRSSSESNNEDGDKPPVSIAKRRFVEATFKIIAELVAKRDIAIREREQQQMETIMRQMKKGNASVLPPLFETNKALSVPKRSKWGALAQHKSLQEAASKHGGSTQWKKARVRLPEILPEINRKGPASVYVSKAGGFGMHLSSLVRLARFRKMLSRRENGTRASDESEVDEEAEEEIPRQPRFCATLSPEAQYAMMKGYEDVLLENLRPNKSLASHVLYRVKTPHQRVVALQVAEQYSMATSQPRKHTQTFEYKHLLAPEDARMRVFVTETTRGSKMGHRQVSRHTSIASDISDITSSRDNDTNPKNSSVEVTDQKRDKQIRLTCRFQKAMDILDAIKISKGLPVTSQSERRRVRNPLKVYNAWSQGWSREFKFQYA